MCCCCQCGASASKNFIFHKRISIIPRSKLISTHFLNQFECNHRKIAALNCENMFGVGNFIRKTSMTLLPSSHFAYSLARVAKKSFSLFSWCALLSRCCCCFIRFHTLFFLLALTLRVVHVHEFSDSFTWLEHFPSVFPHFVRLSVFFKFPFHYNMLWRCVLFLSVFYFFLFLRSCVLRKLKLAQHWRTRWKLFLYVIFLPSFVAFLCSRSQISPLFLAVLSIYWRLMIFFSHFPL